MAGLRDYQPNVHEISAEKCSILEWGKIKPWFGHWGKKNVLPDYSKLTELLDYRPWDLPKHFVPLHYKWPRTKDRKSLLGINIIVLSPLPPIVGNFFYCRSQETTPQPEPEASVAIEMRICFTSFHGNGACHPSRKSQCSISFCSLPFPEITRLVRRPQELIAFISRVKSLAAGTAREKATHFPVSLWRVLTDSFLT